jgi:hypothetical protein
MVDDRTAPVVEQGDRIIKRDLASCVCSRRGYVFLANAKRDGLPHRFLGSATAHKLEPCRANSSGWRRGLGLKGADVHHLEPAFSIVLGVPDRGSSKRSAGGFKGNPKPQRGGGPRRDGASE